MTDNTPMTLLILPTEEVQKLELLKKTNWQYVESVTDVTQESDIEESLKEIKTFYGGAQ